MGATGKSRPGNELCHVRGIFGGVNKIKKILRLEMENLWFQDFWRKQLIIDGIYLVMFLYLYFFLGAPEY